MKTPSMKSVRLVLTFACAAAGIALSSCRTVNGFGQDVKRTGNAIQKTAN